MVADESNDDKTQSFVALTKDTAVSHYTIIDKIGSGGMGEVYLAQDTQLDRKVALKFLPPHLCADEDCRKRFKREAQAAAKLSHPNIIHVYEVSEYQGRPFFAMEHVEGRSLSEHTSGKDLTIEQILELAIQICGGLHAAHEEGVTHRDIKPSNILIDSHGRARIVDFGLASVRDADQLTKTGSTMGTVGYMSPEQVQGKEVDHRSDLFSLGVVLYELITKQNPFRRDSEAATLRAVSDDHPEPLARFKRDIPEGVQAIIDKALEKDVSTRYQHADGLCSDLMRVKRSLESAQTSVAGVPGKKKSISLWWVSTAVVIIVAGALFITKPWVSETASDQPKKIMLAVLPFENLGDPEDEFFADGITDEITSKVGVLDGLGVIARTSILQYKGTTKRIVEIGSELNVDYILEGTVRWDKSGEVEKVRITPQLIRVSDETHLWADNYERPLTQVFVVQGDIAEKVANALNVNLFGNEKYNLQHSPTVNMEAYNYYLRGKDYHSVSSSIRSTESELAIKMFEKAVALDSTFASANAWLARLYAYDHFNGLDSSGMRLRRAEHAARRAARYSSGGADGHLAMGYYYYYGSRDYEAALREFEAALAMQPNNSELLHAIGAVQRRQGKWDEARKSFEASLSLDPLNPSKHLQLLYVLEPIRRYEECLEVIDHGIAIAPDFADFYNSKFYVIYNLHENLEMAREVLVQAAQVIPECDLGYTWEHFHFWARDYASAASQKCPLEDVRDSVSYYLAKSRIYRAMNDSTTSIALADSARRAVERLLEIYPDYYGHLSRIGLALAYLHRKNEAIESGLRATHILPVSKDAYRGFLQLQALTEIYTVVGEKDLAIDALDSLLSIPSYITVAKLRIDPMWDPLRDHPRFKALLAKYEKIHGT